MQFNDLGSLFNFDGSHGLYEMFAGTFKGYNSLSDMQNIHTELLNKEFKINTNGLSEFTTAQIQAKAATMSLTDSLTTELIAMGKDATFTQKVASGKLTWGKAVNEFGDNLDEIGTKLLESGKLSDKMHNRLSAVLDSGNVNNYKQTVLDALNSVDGLSDSIIDLGTTANQTSSTLPNIFTGIAASAKNLFTTLATNPLTWVSAAAVAAVALEDALTIDYKEANTALQKSSQKYQDTKSNLESLNSELETTQSRITELQGLQDAGTITVAEETELENLQSQNAELERKIQLQERLLAIQSQEAINDAKEAMTKEDHSVAQSVKMGDSKGEKTFKGEVGKSTDTEALKEDLALIKEYESEIPNLEEKIVKLKEETSELSIWDDGYFRKNIELKEAEKELKRYQESINTLYSDIDSRSETIQSQLDALKLDPSANAAQIRELEKALDSVTNIDLSPTGKQVKQIESYFNGSKTSNTIKDQLLEAVKSGGKATDALHEMGITLNDLGITGDGKKAVFDDYFSGLVQSAEEAQQAINSIDGSVDGVKAAFESENKDADWNSMAEFANQANELYKQRKVGTDDFKSFVQFISPDIINPDAEGFKYDADAYVAAWENAREKVKRYFDSENPITSATNFTNDLIDKGLASKAGDDITWGFKNSAEAAKALGISVEATEVAMRNLESYGAEFDDVMFSGEGLKRYENALDRIKSLRDSMEEGESKKKLSGLIENWDSELAGYQADLSTLTEDQIVKIEFQYDLASIRSEIEELQNEIDSTGGDTKEWGSLNSKKRTLRDKLASQDEMSGATDDSGYQDSLSSYDKLAQKLVVEYDTLGEKGRRSIQQQQSALLDLQNSYLDMFQNGNIIDWESFLNTNEANDIFDQLAKDTNKSVEAVKKELSELANINIEPKEDNKANDETNDGTKEVNIKANDEASDTITSVLAELMRLPEEEVSKLIADDKASDKVINVLSSLSGIPEEKLTEINATDGATAVVTYALSQILGIPEEKMTELLATDKASSIAGKVKDSINKIPKKHDSKLAAIDNASPIARNVSATINSIKDKTVTISAVVSGTVNNAVNTVRSAMASLGGANLGGAKANGTLLPARANGTGYNVLNYRPAYTDGKISLSQDEEALVNELGTESIIRNGKWMLLPGGMHVQNLKKGDIVLTAEQTRDLLNTGRTNGHARAYAEGTLGNAYANGWRLPSAVTNNTGTSKKKPSSSSSSSKSSSSNSSDTSDKADEFKETIDYIEMKIDRIERQIKNLERVAGSAYNTFTKRNTALRNQISSITEEISTQQAGYDRYIQQANSVSLSENYKSQVRDGAIDISTITDEELAKNIKEYQEW